MWGSGRRLPPTRLLRRIVPWFLEVTIVVAYATEECQLRTKDGVVAH